MQLTAAQVLAEIERVGYHTDLRDINIVVRITASTPVGASLLEWNVKHVEFDKQERKLIFYTEKKL